MFVKVDSNGNIVEEYKRGSEIIIGDVKVRYLQLLNGVMIDEANANGIYKIKRNKPPSYDAMSEKLVHNNGVVGNEYVYDYSVVPLTQEEIDARLVAYNEPEAVEARAAQISTNATKHIESVYSPLKQRKMMSIMIKLQEVLISGGTLTAEEAVLKQSILDADNWITSVRDVENIAIANDTNPDDVVFPVKPTTVAFVLP